jgi:hypothetical protein
MLSQSNLWYDTYFQILKCFLLQCIETTLNFHVDSLPRVEDRDVVQEAKDIVDGHRDATLLLLWKILYDCELRHVRSS